MRKLHDLLYSVLTKKPSWPVHFILAQVYILTALQFTNIEYSIYSLGILVFLKEEWDRRDLTEMSFIDYWKSPGWKDLVSYLLGAVPILILM